MIRQSWTFDGPSVAACGVLQTSQVDVKLRRFSYKRRKSLTGSHHLGSINMFGESRTESNAHVELMLQVFNQAQLSAHNIRVPKSSCCSRLYLSCYHCPRPRVLSQRGRLAVRSSLHCRYSGEGTALPYYHPRQRLDGLHYMEMSHC